MFDGLFPRQTVGLMATQVAGVSPRITEPPSMRPDLLKRDTVSSSLSTYLNIFAPNATCGYLNGNSSESSSFRLVLHRPLCNRASYS
jgi:hypothetical protein